MKGKMSKTKDHNPHFLKHVVYKDVMIKLGYFSSYPLKHGAYKSKVIKS